MKLAVALLLLATFVACEKDWWETATFYQIYPRSFRDSDGDGIGDLKGIIQKLDHLKQLGITATWLSPIMKSPMVDFGYDISDFKDIDPIFGTMKDFEDLIAKAKELDIKIIMDFVPNHSSDEHEWFIKSENREPGFEDYYIWKDGKNCTFPEPTDPEPTDPEPEETDPAPEETDPAPEETDSEPEEVESLESFWKRWPFADVKKKLPEVMRPRRSLDDDEVPCDPPNNWNAVFRGSAWEWSPKRKQFYFHQFHPRQPDLNFENPKVEQEMKDVLEFWLEKGVSGFRIDAINHLMEDKDFPDEPRNPDVDDPESYSYTLKHYSLDLKETYDRVYDWRVVLDAWSEKTKETKILMTEAYANMSSVMLYYQSADGKRQGAHFPFNFMLIFQKATSTANDFMNAINEWMDAMPEGKTANWVLGNHDQPRFGSKYGVHRIAAMHTIALTLPGIAVTYYGDEIGMVDYREISWEDTQDPQACKAPKELYRDKSRDPARTPFQWDDTNYGGFVDTLKAGSKLWLPLHPDFRKVNLKNQIDVDDSIYNYYRKLVDLRNNLQDRDFKMEALSETVLAYTRGIDGAWPYVVVANLGTTRQTVDLTKLPAVKDQIKIVLPGVVSAYRANDMVDAKSFTITAGDAIILYSGSTKLAGSFVLMVIVVIAKFFHHGW